MKKKYCTFFFLILLLQNSFAQSPRHVIDFNANWKFYLGNDSTAISTNYNDAAWRKLSLPHDWSIEGDFSKDNPATTQGGALPGGIGWYRKIFTVPVSSKNRNVSVEFDGVYRNSEVWINGHYLGKRPNGYISFQYDLTPHLRYGTEKNVITVKVDNSQQPNSRWYTGSGIYRNVRLVIKNKIAIDYSGTFITTSLFSFERGHWEFYNKNNPGAVFGDVHINAIPISNGTAQPQKIILVNTIYDATGKKLEEQKTGIIDIDASSGLSTVIDRTDAVWGVKDPMLWTVDHPYLYKLVSAIYKDDIKLDEITTNIGFRKFEFDREKGFFLNGQPLKINGVCMHHDLGALGAAFNYRAAERQLQILKEMGCNAIRTAHNPPAPGFLDLCDKMGFLVMDEAFDMWQKKKNKFDYYLDFKAWHERDLRDLILRDRNHPSIFMWSIGNEIREQFDSTGIAITKELVDIVKRLDRTRPVTSALTETDTVKNFIYQSNALDVIGWNYNQQNFPEFLKRYPGKIFIGAETTSALSTRGQYDPSDTSRIWPPKGKKDMENINGNWAVSAYDNVKSNWGSTHEETWKIIKKHDFLSGLFVWTGFDYLGEPTPFPWPARSSYFGIIDLAGFPKDVYYMYQSEWTNKPVLHIFPHWNHEPGKIIDVWAYYNNADEVELFLNGTSLGTRKKINDDLHVMWRVPFEPGIIKAISRKNGQAVLVKEIKTAGKPAKIELITNRKMIKANGEDLAFVTVRILDGAGNPVPDAGNLIKFSISGNANIAATDNGYQADTVSFTSDKRQVWKGMALVIMKATKKKGNSTLTATSPGLQPGTIALKIAE